MANQRLTDKSALGTNPASDDLLMVVDTSDTTGSAQGTSKSVKNEFLIKTKILTIPPSALANLSAAPEKILDTPASGFQYQVLCVTAYAAYGSSQNTNMVEIQFNFEGIYQTGFAANHWCSARRFYLNQGTASNTYTYICDNIMRGNATLDGSLDGKPFWITSDANFNGDWHLHIYCTYQLLKVS
jgi:hypothetical protein